LKPETKAEEQQKGFNEIAGMLADWIITTEEACELFVEWIEELKKDAATPIPPTTTTTTTHAPGV